ncbi:hypothetical protein H0H93_000384 [Arthromyces matolae]|nr:hypothetical protein H0H93_000384 [Arthromyces matolae]
MFTCWSVFTDPGFPAKYNEFRPDFHVVMKELVDMLLEPAWAAIYDKGVESVAGTVLGIWLQWETVQGYKEMYRGVPSPVYDRQHLKSLQRLLIRAIIREKVPDNDTDMENNLAPHGLKRHNSPEGNDYDPGHMHLPKMRRLLPIISGHKSHNVHDVEMTG